MPGRDRATVNLVGPALPDLKRLVQAAHSAGATRKNKGRATDASLSTVGLVVVVVQCGGGRYSSQIAWIVSRSLNLAMYSAWTSAGKMSRASDHESSMWLTMTAGAWVISCSGTGSGAARKDQTQNPMQNSMPARRNASPVGTMSSTARLVTTPG